jgi:hypothetical protein
LKLSELTGVTVDPERKVASVVGGTLWGDVVAAAAPHGLAALHGSAPDVAVAGYVLGGGLSFYARRHGLASNSVRAVDVVTADGSLVRADADTNADLFWAVRGGGGNFGVVVRIELDLIPMADPTAGMLLWDRERAPEVIRAWVGWTRDLPDSVTTSMRVMSFPPLPELPPFLSGRQIVVMDGAIVEDAERAAELLAPLRALGPEMDTFAPLPLPGVTEIHMDPPGPAPAVSDHAVLTDIDDTTIEALLQLVGPGTTTPLLMAELRHLGGALAEPADGGAPVLRRDGPLPRDRRGRPRRGQPGRGRAGAVVHGHPGAQLHRRRRSVRDRLRRRRLVAAAGGAADRRPAGPVRGQPPRLTGPGGWFRGSSPALLAPTPATSAGGG